MPMTWEMEADLCDSAGRMPVPGCGSTFGQYCQHVRGFHFERQCETINFERAKCVPYDQQAGRGRKSTELHRCCLIFSLVGNCIRTYKTASFRFLLRYFRVQLGRSRVIALLFLLRVL